MYVQTTHYAMSGEAEGWAWCFMPLRGVGWAFAVGNVAFCIRKHAIILNSSKIFIFLSSFFILFPYLCPRKLMSYDR